MHLCGLSSWSIVHQQKLKRYGVTRISAVVCRWIMPTAVRCASFHRSGADGVVRFLTEERDAYILALLPWWFHVLRLLSQDTYKNYASIIALSGVGIKKKGKEDLVTP